MNFQDLKNKFQNQVGNLLNRNKDSNKINQSTQNDSSRPNPTNNIPNFTNVNSKKINTQTNQNNNVPNNDTNNSQNKKQETQTNDNINTNSNNQNSQSNTVTNLIVPDEYNKYQQKYNKAHAQKSFIGKLKSKFNKIGTAQQIDTSGENRFNDTIIDELGYKGLTNDHNHFLILATPYHATRGYAEILQIGGASLSNLPPQLADQIMIKFINFLRAYMPDMTFVSIHLPNDSKAQQHYWSSEKRDINYKILQGNLSYHMQEYYLARRQFINANLKHFQDIDMSVDNQAFVLMLFARTEKELRQDTHYAFAFGGDVLKLSYMSVHQKETFLTRLNNPNISAR